MITQLSFQRPLVMGIVNITPDSFSGDGVMRQDDYVAAAVGQARQMVVDGADILDIGGESTRPGATPVSMDEEMRRVAPVIKVLRDGGVTVPIAVDTFKAPVAEAALEAGADIINDITALTHDTMLAGVVARYRAWIVLMHNRSKADAVTHDARLGGLYHAPVYTDILTDVARDLKQRVDHACNAGISPDRIILDPGLGFGKTSEQNLMLIDCLDGIKQLGYPVLLGPSRKGFIGQVLDLPVEDRVEGTAVCVTVGLMRGADIMRVHDVKAMARVTRMTDALIKARVL